MAERFTKSSPFLKRDTVAPPVEQDADLKEYKAGIKPGDEGVSAKGRRPYEKGSRMQSTGCRKWQTN